MLLLFYHFPTENSHLKEWIGHGLMSRWEMNGGLKVLLVEESV